ncbi:MAG: hypothetical protein HKN92_12430, partial [Chitinophagales bacterium]|nr:hypothetical protein [Chitinophagales bacterium]
MNSTANILSNLALIDTPAIQTGMLWNLVLFFLLVCVLYFLSVFTLKGKLNRKEKKSIVLKKDIAPLISTMLFHQESASRQQKEELLHAKVLIQEMLKNPRNRRVVSEIFLDIRTDLTGSTQERLIKIYKDLGLHTYAIDKLESWRWEVVCQGINELTEMRVDESYIYVRKFINDNRSIVRKQAQLATVALKHEGINYFLDTSSHKISDWQQLKLIKTLQNMQDYTPPPFRLWLTSSNKDVVLFSLRLIKSFKQDDALESLKKLVKHRDDTIKTETIECIRAFRFVEAIPIFKTIFWNCHSSVKLALLSAVADMGSLADIPFLKEVEQNEKDFVIKSKAIGAINALAPETILPTTAINESLAATDSVVGDKTEAHDQYLESLHSDTFQKYDPSSEKDDLLNELLLENNENEVFFLAEDLPADDQSFFLRQKQPKEIDKTEVDHIHSTARSARNINVEYKSLEVPSSPKEDVNEGSDNLMVALEMEEVLLQFSPTSESTDNTNYEHNEGDEAELNKEALMSPGKDDDEVPDVPESSDLLEPYFEIESLTEEPGSENSDLSDSSIDFEIEVYPGSFENKLNSSELIWKNYKNSDQTITYYDAMEKSFYASNLEGQLRLLDDILHLGDERDINFLHTLKEHKSQTVRQRAERNINLMVERLYPDEDSEAYLLPLKDNNPD